MTITSIIMIIGAVFIGVFSLPNLINVLKTKNTVGINLPMYIIFVLACITFCVYGGGMCAEPKMLGSGLPILLSNFFCVFIGAVTLGIKFSNMRKARKANMTESQYWETHLKKTSEVK